jgi:hypothetical protein
VKDGTKVTVSPSKTFVSPIPRDSSTKDYVPETVPDEVSELKAKLQRMEQSLCSQYDIIKKLESRVAKVEADQILLESRSVVKDAVISTLRQQVIHLQQYTRRYSVTISGIDRKYNEKPADLKQEVAEIIGETNSPINIDDVDKLHRNGPRRGKKQEVIVRFKSHSAKESFYRSRKSIKRENIKVRPSLTQARKDLLHESQDVIRDMFPPETTSEKNPPEFVMADIHGNIQVKMSHKTRNGLFFTFNTIEELLQVIQRNQTIARDNDGNNSDAGSSSDDMGFGLFD